jgi:uncharacterized membrane protein
MDFEKRSVLITYGIVLLAAIVWTGGIILTPILEEHAVRMYGLDPAPAGHGAWLLVIVMRGFYHAVCHQIPERSIWIGNYTMAVCARCFGIYLGYLTGLVVYPFSGRFTRTDNPPRIWLIAAALPTAVDFLGGYLGVFQNTILSRSITGAIAGFACVFYTMPGLVSALRMFFRSASRFGRIAYSKSNS